MTEGAPVQWDQLTWEEISALNKDGMTMAMLPVGATEQHGPHLATGVDCVTATQLASAVSAQTGVPVLPTLPFGCSLGHSKRWPGTVSLSPHTLIDCIVEIGEWLWATGFKKLLIINGHVTNFAPLRCALEILRSKFDDMMIAIRNVADVSGRVHHEFFADAQDWHANAAETALMLELAPEQVRPDRIKEGHDPDRTHGLLFSHPVNRTSRNGATGHPCTATREHGEQLFRWMVDDLVSQVRSGLTESPPLDQSYFATV